MTIKNATFDISKKNLGPVHLLTKTDKWYYLQCPIIEKKNSCLDIGAVPRSPEKWNWNRLSFLPFIFSFEQCGLTGRMWGPPPTLTSCYQPTMYLRHFQGPIYFPCTKLSIQNVFNNAHQFDILILLLTVGFWCQVIHKKFLQRFDTSFEVKMMVKIYAIEIIFKSHKSFQSYQLAGPANSTRDAGQAGPVSW